MENNEMPFFGGEEYLQQELEELLKNPPQPVKFTYSLEQLKDAVEKYVPVVDNTPARNYIEDYYEYTKEEYKHGNKEELLKAVYEYYALEDKNDLEKISEINNRIIENNGDDIELPNEIYTTISELRNQEKYLRDMKKIDDYNRKQSLQVEQENIRIQVEQ